MATKDPEDVQGGEAYARLIHLAAESAFEATDEEIEEEMREAGEDLDDNAERLRAKMLAAAERGRKHRLKVLRRRWKRHAARIQAPRRRPGCVKPSVDPFGVSITAGAHLNPTAFLCRCLCCGDWHGVTAGD